MNYGPYPNIVPCLVFPFEKTCAQGERRYPGLVFAQRGSVVLFAEEATREYGVGTLDSTGEVATGNPYKTLDLAARAFLSREQRAP
jgi:hypothetical protein